MSAKRSQVTKNTSPKGQDWRNRIIRHDNVDPNALMPNPKNWRRHSSGQAAALESVLDDVGWVQSVIVNERSGNLVDGHLRVLQAIERGQEKIPVTYVDLSEKEENEILATLDPLAMMASANTEALDALLSTISVNNQALQDLLMTTYFDLHADAPAGSDLIKKQSAEAEWTGMPDFHQDDLLPHRTLYLHFANDDDVAAFAALLGQQVTASTKYLWYPPQEIDHYAHLRFVEDEDAAEVPDLHYQ